jgi:hypothetical protein
MVVLVQTPPPQEGSDPRGFKKRVQHWATLTGSVQFEMKQANGFRLMSFDSHFFHPIRN